MYCSFYGIREKPFSITPDPKYLYLGRTHQQAFAHLVYGIRERGGFIVVTGGVGTGKTTLCRALLTHLDADTRVAFIFNPTLSAQELLRCINEDFEIPSEGTTRKELIDELNRFLLEKKKEGKNTVLIIDEAQNLEMEVLEHIRLLSNLETDTEKLLQIILVGQPEFRQILEQPSLVQLNQRITVRYHLTPLGREETDAYVRHRLAVSGADDKIHFTPGALRRIRRYTKGVPRLINVLCDRALLAGYSRRTRQIDARVIKYAHREVSSNGHTEIFRRFLRGFRSAYLPSILIVVLLALVGYGLHSLRPAGETAHAGKRLSGLNERGGGEVPALKENMNLSGMEGTAGEYGSDRTGQSMPMRSTKDALEGRGARPGGESGRVGEKAQETVPEQDEADAWGSQESVRSLRALLGTQTIQQSRIEAFLAVVERWNGVPLDERLRAAVSENNNIYSAVEELGFQIYRVKGGFEEIRVLDLPAVLSLEMGDIPGTRYVALVGLHGPDAEVLPSLPDGSGRVPEVLLENLWSGTAYVLWKDGVGGKKILTAGMQGEEVTWLQSALKDLGYLHASSTGVLDGNTQAALRDFQRDYGLQDDGILGPQSRIVLLRAREKGSMPLLEERVPVGAGGEGKNS